MKITKTQLKQIIKEELKGTQLLNEWEAGSIGPIADLAEKIFQANPEGFARLFFEADYSGKQYYYWTDFTDDVNNFKEGVSDILDARSQGEIDETQSAQQILYLYDNYPYLEQELEQTFWEGEAEGDPINGKDGYYDLLVGHRNAGEMPSDPSELPPYAELLGYFFGYLYTAAEQAAEQLRSKQADGDLEPEQTPPDDEQVNRAMMGRLSEMIKQELAKLLKERAK